MATCSFRPYEGNKPYIFISYAHKDSHLVYPILDDLTARGYRVWYDDGIIPGSEWAENIAQHLNDCAVTLAFISPNSIASDYCRREITFALSKKKPFLSIMLEPTDLPLGIELQLSAQQCVMGYAFQTRQEFVNKICLCPDLKPCLAPPATPKAAPASQPPVAQTPHAAPAVPAPENPPAPQPAPQPKPSAPVGSPFPTQAGHAPSGYPPQTPVNPPQNTGSGKKPIGLWVGIAVAVIAFIIALVIFLPSGPDNAPDGQQSPTYINVVSDVNVKSDISELTLTNEVIDQKVINQIETLTNLTKLTFTECDIDLNSLTLDSNILTFLKFDNCTGSISLIGLNTIPSLQTLIVNGDLFTSAELDLPLLETFWLTDDPNFSDLTQLSKCTSLELVGVDGTAVSDLSPLIELPKLIAISADRCPITSIDCLVGKSSLQELSLNNCQIQNVTKKMPKGLTHLYLNSNPLQDISGFSHLSSLVEIDIGNTGIADFSCIINSAKTLRCANVAGCEMDVADAIKNCTNMEELIIDNVFLFDADCFSQMTNLRYLSANTCNLYNAHSLITCIRLEELYLLNNAIDNLEFLTYIYTDDNFILDLSMNTVKNASKLPERIYYSGLSLFDNPVDFSTIGDLRGTDLILTYNETLNATNLPNGLDFKNITIIDCPEDQKLSLKQVFPPNSITFMTLAEFLA
jgi:hypothetical protein